MNITRTLLRCSPGHYYAALPPPGKVSDRGWCYTCSAGTYSDERNRDAQCKSCRVCSQELGLIEMQPCRPTADTLCRCRDRFVLEHGRCQPIEVHFSHGTTIEAEKEHIVGAMAKSARIPRPHLATIAPVEVGETTESAKSIHSKTIERALRTSDTRWFLERHEARHVETTMLPGTASHTEIQPESVAFFIGSIPVTTAVLIMGIVSFVSIAALAAVALTLCVKRRQRNNGGKRQSVEVALESEYHVYEDPDTLIPDILPPLRIRVAAAASEAPGCAASPSSDDPSSPIASENSFAPLLGGDQTSAADEPSAYCGIEHSHASIHKESKLSQCLIVGWPVTGACSSSSSSSSSGGGGGGGGGGEAHVLHNNLFAPEICSFADGAAPRSAAAADMIGAATASCVELPASDEIRAEGGSSHRSECASKIKAEAIAAEGLRDGGYIYSRT